MNEWDRWVRSETAAIQASGRWRELRPPGGQGLVSFSSNDYLGLSQHHLVRAAAVEVIGRDGTGAGSARLISGNRQVHEDLERDLAGWRGTDAALVFPTGYQANLGVLTTFGAGARIVSDQLNHASIIDGARLAKAEVAVFRHRDIDHAAALVAAAPGRAVVVSDTVFSMDGDMADVEALTSLCAGAGALLVLDDAHAVFPTPAVDADCPCIRIGTLSKALGSQGGYAVGPRAWIDLLINRARSFVFTTGLAPASAAAAMAAIGVYRSRREGERLRAVLRSHIDALRIGHPSPIIPFVVGDEVSAVAASHRLLDEGILVPAIRPPTVPEGTCRLRVSLSAAHSNEDVARLIKAVARLA